MMVSFEPRKNHPLKKLKWDFGLFNGQGVVGNREFDSYKDIISRLSLKPYYLNKDVSVTGGLSLLYGGLANNSKYVFDMAEKAGAKYFQVDSSASNYGAKSPRQYFGGDIQAKIRHGWGATEIRAEYWWGKQTAYLETSETPADYRGAMPFYRRNFNGAFLIILQNIINDKNQIGIKYDFYDPNTDLNGTEINNPSLGHSYTDIKFNTLMFGFNKYFSENLKMFIWYDIVRNESTGLNDYQGDVRDNILTCRLQYTF
ncbi:MAG: porin, partial [Flavitalea sp.]